MDDFHLIAALKYLGPIFSTLKTILHECVGVEINLSKSSLNVLQASTIANPRNALTLTYEQCPILAELPLVTEGFICVGTPIGPLPYIRNFMTKRLTELKAEFQNLLSYPYPHDFMLFVRYCCNLKIAHLLRHLGPQILDYAERFDAIIDNLNDEYYDLRLQSQALISLYDIPDNLPSLSEAQIAQLATVQIRSLPSDGGIDILPMREVAIPAFYAAHLRHFRKLLQEGVPGPYLRDNDSSSLFSESFFQAQAAFELRKAVPVKAETDIHPPFIIPEMVCPHFCLFQEADVASAVTGVPKILPKVTNQKYLTQW
jgi:hypothetical protein